MNINILCAVKRNSGWCIMLYRIHSISDLENAWKCNWVIALARVIAREMKDIDTHRRATSYLARMSKLSQGNYQEDKND